MALGEIWWLNESLNPRELQDALEALLIGGLVLKNPGTGATNLIDDDDGRQVEGGINSLVERWLAGRIVNLQFWVSSESDVIVTVDRSSNAIILDLDGLTCMEAKRTAFASVGAASLSQKTRAVIVDRNLPDSGENWLSYFNDGHLTEVEPPCRADLLMVAKPGDGRYGISVDPNSWLMKPNRVE